uniref:Uncharacterized protein n=1 Tax=Macaca fascicularis TaxID=9541 RepID=A0A7N9ICQ9_MACFA
MDLNRHFFKNDIKIANRYMKMCPTSLFIRKMQIKITMRYYVIPIRIVIIKKTRDNKCRQGCREKRILVHCWWECRLVQPLWKTVWRFLQKLKIELPYDPEIPLLGIYQKKMKSPSPEDSCTPMFIVALFRIVKIIEII